MVPTIVGTYLTLTFVIDTYTNCYKPVWQNKNHYGLIDVNTWIWLWSNLSKLSTSSWFQNFHLPMFANFKTFLSYLSYLLNLAKIEQKPRKMSTKLKQWQMIRLNSQWWSKFQSFQSFNVHFQFFQVCFDFHLKHESYRC